jgi:hypothetical protein
MRSWDVHTYLEFGDRFPVGKVAVRGLFVLGYAALTIFFQLFHAHAFDDEKILLLIHPKLHRDIR